LRRCGGVGEPCGIGRLTLGKDRFLDLANLALEPLDALFWRDWFARGSGERRKGEGEKQKSAQEHGVGPDL
jgi:hypothetical protein